MVVKVTSVTPIMAPGYEQSTKDYSDFEIEDLPESGDEETNTMTSPL